MLKVETAVRQCGKTLALHVVSVSTAQTPGHSVQTAGAGTFMDAPSMTLPLAEAGTLLVLAAPEVAAE